MVEYRTRGWGGPLPRRGWPSCHPAPFFPLGSKDFSFVQWLSGRWGERWILPRQGVLMGDSAREGLAHGIGRAGLAVGHLSGALPLVPSLCPGSQESLVFGGICVPVLLRPPWQRTVAVSEASVEGGRWWGEIHKSGGRGPYQRRWGH